jgi:hypothetical protein
LNIFHAFNPDFSKHPVAQSILYPVMYVIKFAESVPDFCSLSGCDQESLLYGSTMELYLCSSLLFSDDDRMSENELEDKLPIHSIWTNDISKTALKFFHSIKELRIDDASCILYLLLILFSPDRCQVVERERILTIQTKYSFLLYKYLLYNYETRAESIYTKLLLSLTELRHLHDMHQNLNINSVCTKLSSPSTSLIINSNLNKEDDQVAANDADADASAVAAAKNLKFLKWQNSPKKFRKMYDSTSSNEGSESSNNYSVSSSFDYSPSSSSSLSPVSTNNTNECSFERDEGDVDVEVDDENESTKLVIIE